MASKQYAAAVVAGRTSTPGPCGTVRTRRPQLASSGIEAVGAADRSSELLHMLSCPQCLSGRVRFEGADDLVRRVVSVGVLADELAID
ncbi:hypothetical protein [Roseateles sp.]|jgi:hypothetical protein|uniref:hypothetical protein n=1 Tax=Roseateles sp. TaxID=1971397 RepID=UPI003919AD99